MFFLRLTLAITLAILATSDASAQLFRFRQRAAQHVPQQVPQTPSRFNPNTYQYTQLPRPQTTVPSTRYATQPRTANYYQQQDTGTNVAPDKVNAQPSGQRIVMLTLRDPRTGRLFQRPYLVNNPQPVAAQTTQQTQVATLPMTPIDDALPGARPSASSVVVQAPANAGPSSVAQTTFDSPILDPVEPEPKKEFSIFEAGTDSDDAPELKATEPAVEAKTSAPMLDEPELTTTVAAEPTAAAPVLTEPTPSEPAPQPELELELDIEDESASVDPKARTQALPFDSAGELDLDIDFAPLNSQN